MTLVEFNAVAYSTKRGQKRVAINPAHVSSVDEIPPRSSGESMTSIYLVTGKNYVVIESYETVCMILRTERPLAGTMQVDSGGRMGSMQGSASNGY